MAFPSERTSPPTPVSGYKRLGCEESPKLTVGMPQTKEAALIPSNSKKIKKPLGKTRSSQGDPRYSRDFRSVRPRNTIPYKEFPSHFNFFQNAINIQKVHLCSFQGPAAQERPLYSAIAKEISPEKAALRQAKQAFYQQVFTKPKPAKTPCKTSAKLERPRKTLYKKLDTISVKDAMRDKEWLSKGKEQVIRDLSLALAASNGMTVKPPETQVYYKYYLGPGNNSNLVRQVLSTRWWWVRVSEEEKYSANLVWTQLKEKEFLANLPSLKGQIEHHSASPAPCAVVAHTRFTSRTGDAILNPNKVVDLSPLSFDLLTKSKSFTTVNKSEYTSGSLKLHNRLEGNCHISNKKGLLHNMKAYYTALGRNPFEVFPKTYHVISMSDPTYDEFLEEFTEGYWIVKPGENTNRGYGITVCESLSQIKAELSQAQHTYIVQKYIEQPFLVHRRKFDIRCYALVTAYNGVIQGYFYQEGYIRTASRLYNLEEVDDRFVHLTNDAVQFHCEEYGKFEFGNKMSYADFQRYLDNHTNMCVNFVSDVVPTIKSIVKDTIQAVFLKLDPQQRAHTFEIFGYDFILDSSLKPWLLEVNTNPCLALSSPHLTRIIPAMLENSFKIALDPVFPEPSCLRRAGITEVFSENKYELVFHSEIDGVELLETLQKRGTQQSYLKTHQCLAELSEDEEDYPDEEEELAA